MLKGINRLVENPGEKARSMLEIDHPRIECAKIAVGMYVEASRATSIGEFHERFERAMSTCGPRLIEVILQWLIRVR
jgi:acetolactate synthase-1/2/3 large subunit